MSNRLAAETSPYLLQHAANPVDWQPWDEAALRAARAQDRPILLSIGYSTCHWCHVMARESFEDPATAAAINRHFIAIKVDREERPDLDQIYQTAHYLLTQRPGGWPLTLFLTPDQVPFFGGTYFPDRPRHGLPAFIELLDAVAREYAARRGDIAAQNQRLLEALRRAGPAGSPAEPDGAPLKLARDALVGAFDARHGGFGGAPKFPHVTDLEFLLRQGDAQARRVVRHTLERMAGGGIHDQLGGGFFRYSVDAEWQIPHFEKMLYDNGALLALYADAAVLFGEPLFAATARRLASWLEREMLAADGGFCAALDADSAHEEGAYYVWNPQQVAAVLSREQYAVAALAWGLDGPANFEGRAWHLRQLRGAAEIAGELGCPLDEVRAGLDAARAALFEARARRQPPQRDAKRLTAWNALAVRGLARAARRLDEPHWLRLAQDTVDFLRRELWRDGRLLASYAAGRAALPAYLDDHAWLLDALLELLQAEWRDADLAFARDLADALLERFEDREAGGFYFTAADHEPLIARSKTGHDNATPSGNGVAAQALLRLGRLLDAPRYVDAGERCLRLFQRDMARQPGGFSSLLLALDDHLHPPARVLLAGPLAGVTDWRRRLDAIWLPRAAAYAPPPDAADLPPPLRAPQPAAVSARLCATGACRPPVADFAELVAQLGAEG